MSPCQGVCFVFKKVRILRANRYWGAAIKTQGSDFLYERLVHLGVQMPIHRAGHVLRRTYTKESDYYQDSQYQLNAESIK